MMRVLPALFPALLVLLGTAAVMARKEPASGIDFPEISTSPGLTPNLKLTGVGVRAKKLLGPVAVKVYGLGLYVDARTAASKLAAFKDLKAANKKLFEETESQAFDKLIVLKMARKVGASTMVNALAESVRPRMGGGDGGALSKFQDLLLEGLKGGSAECGMQFGFGISSRNTLIVCIDGNKKGEIASAPLARALLNVYIGDNPVSKDAKASIGEGLLKVVNNQ